MKKKKKEQSKAGQSRAVEGGGLPQGFADSLAPLLADWEEGDRRAFFAALMGPPFRALRVNALKPGYASFDPGEYWDVEALAWESRGYRLLGEDAPAALAWHQCGLYYMQEPSAMAPVWFLDPRPGERVLDLCAAPGGKSGQIAAAMEGRGLLLANEVDGARAQILSENMERLGVQFSYVTSMAPEALASRFCQYFDKILVDAPCSGEGMFAKSAEARGQWSPQLVRDCARRQREILARAGAMLRPGGRLVYSTCTFAPEENEEVVSAFLEAHGDFSAVGPGDLPPGIDRGLVPGCYRLWPHRARSNGHFVAVLERDGIRGGLWQVSPSSGEGEYPIRSRSRRLKREDFREEAALVAAFCRENLREGELPWWAREGRWWRRGEQIYALPEERLDLEGLRLLRAGLHIGSCQRGRFAPSHALALVLSPAEAIRVLELDGELAREYLAGQAWADGRISEDGWYLLCHGGYSLGWGRAAGGRMKNHYPKGLRRH